MKMFCFTSVRRLGLPGLTADRAKCNPHFCCCSTRQTRTWAQSLRSELTRRRLCIGWNWLQDRRERRRVTTMARESDFNWEDDLMTKWVISLLSLLCGISLSLEQHIYLKQPTNTNKLRSTTNKQTINYIMVRSYQRQESHLAKLAKSHGRDYGKPKPGSESEKRSIAYQVDSEATVLMSISFSYTYFCCSNLNIVLSYRKKWSRSVYTCVRWSLSLELGELVFLYFCICIFEFVYLYLQFLYCVLFRLQ